MPNGGFRLEPAYDMNRDGLTLLAMSFTGEKALEFKLRYIEAFNQMEAALKGDVTNDTLPPANGERQETEGTKLRFVVETRLTWGEKAAQQMWIKKGLETVPAMFDGTRQPDLFEAEARP